PGPRAHLARLLPIARRFEVALPEWKRPALSRTHRIHRAALFAVVEHAVAIGLLAQRPPTVAHSCVTPFQFIARLAAEFGQCCHSLFRHPDEARLPRAALAAARAAETQTIPVPRPLAVVGVAHPCIIPGRSEQVNPSRPAGSPGPASVGCPGHDRLRY